MTQYDDILVFLVWVILSLVSWTEEGVFWPEDMLVMKMRFFCIAVLKSYRWKFAFGRQIADFGLGIMSSPHSID